MKSIFLADDDVDDRMFFEDALKEVNIPTQLTLAKNGLELMNNLKILSAHPPPDVIFLDMNMPLNNGLKCLKEIRATPKLKEIPVVIFSTTASDDAVNATFEHGANYYICKPSSFPLLVKIIETVLTLEMRQTPHTPKEKYLLQLADMPETALSKATTELYIQNEKLTEEIVIANKELLFQNEEKGKRAEELVIANKELLFQNEEKGKRAEELVIANKELIFQNEEKEKRAEELVIANKELLFQNEEKGKRAEELVIANKELIFQNEEKEKRAEELVLLVKELESFNYISSHDLQEPLRKIQIFSTRLIAGESQNLSERGKEYVLRMQDAANRMQTLISDLLAYTRTTSSVKKFETIDLNPLIEEVIKDFHETIEEKNAIIEITETCNAHIIPFQFRQLMHNLIGNALKFSMQDIPPHIVIKCRNIKYSKKDYCHITITDNGIGFEPQYKDHIFELFQRLHDKEIIRGTGIGLTIVKKIVGNHNGIITATGELNKGATFDIYIPST